MSTGRTCEKCYERIPYGYSHGCDKSKQFNRHTVTTSNFLLAEIKNLLSEIRDELIWTRQEIIEWRGE